MAVVWLVRHGQASWGATDYDVLSDRGREQARVTGRLLGDSLAIVPRLIVAGEMRRQRDTATELAAAAGWSLPPTTDAAWNEFDHAHVIARHSEAEEYADPAQPTSSTSSEPTAPRGGSTQSEDDFARRLDVAVRRWISGRADGDYEETFGEFLGRVRGGLDRLARQLTASSFDQPDRRSRATLPNTPAAATSSGASGQQPETHSAAANAPHAVVVTSGGAIGAAAAMLLIPDADPITLGPVWLRLNWVLANASVTRLHFSPAGHPVDHRLLSFNEHSHLAGKLRTHR